ncbi:MAG TPA: TIGR02996 domain-containing protein, partial [Pirellulales bacterium]
MSHGDAFLQAILADPEDDAPRLIYADWLEERGDPRGEFIRLQCALERLSATDPARPDLEDEAGDLLYQHEQEWTAPLQGIASEWRFRRGFIEEVSIAGEEFVARGDSLFNVSPI